MQNINPDWCKKQISLKYEREQVTPMAGFFCRYFSSVEGVILGHRGTICDSPADQYFGDNFVTKTGGW